MLNTDNNLTVKRFAGVQRRLAPYELMVILRQGIRDLPSGVISSEAGVWPSRDALVFSSYLMTGSFPLQCLTKLVNLHGLGNSHVAVCLADPVDLEVLVTFCRCIAVCDDKNRDNCF